MLRYHVRELIANKEFREKRRITIGEVADTTGINRMTLSKLINHQGHNTMTDNLDKLCGYFECEISDLVTYVQDAENKGDV